MGYQEVSDLAISKYHASYYDGEDYRSNYFTDGNERACYMVSWYEFERL